MNALRTLLLLPVASVVLVSPVRADDARLPIKVGGPFEVQTVKDIAYVDGNDADPKKHKLDLYLPKGPKDFPVFFFIHGGGWTSGDRILYGLLGQVFARNGVGAVIISYRLSPKVQHPAHIQDAVKAFAWTCHHIGEYGGRADQIFVSGHSAGGHLAALLATDEGYLRAEKLSLKNIKGAIPLSGVYTIRASERMEKIFGKDEAVCPQASPMQHVHGSHPPFLVIYASDDFPGCGKMSEAFCLALQKNKVEAAGLEIKDRTHISIMFRMRQEDDPTTQAVLAFVAKHSGLKLTAKEAAKDSKP
jgi:acetyl esterase/lipase